MQGFESIAGVGCDPSAQVDVALVEARKLVKKGDVLEVETEIASGTILHRGLKDETAARSVVIELVSAGRGPANVGVVVDTLNPGFFAVQLLEAAFSYRQLLVNWRVEDEIGVEWKDLGGMAILNLQDIKFKIVHSSAPQYQDSVEHMTDEQLRESIESLRAKRVLAPVKATRVASTPKPTAQDKKLSSVLSGMTPEKKLELMKKLGMV